MFGSKLKYGSKSNPKQEHKREKIHSSILSVKATHFLGRIIDWGGKLGFMPYKWDKNTNRAHFKSGVTVKVIYFLQLLLVILYQIYLLFKCAVILHSPTEKLQKKIRMSYMVFMYVILNVQHLVTIKQFGTIHLLTNNFMDVTQNFNELYGPLKLSGGTKVLRLMKMASFAAFVGCTNAFGVFLAPKSPTLLTSLFDSPENLQVSLKLIIMAYQTFVVLFHFYPVAFYWSLLFYYVYTVIPVIRRMKCTRTKRQLAKSTDLTPIALHRCYNELEILQNNFNTVFGLWTIGIEIFIIVLVVLNIFQAVVFDNVRAFVLCLTGCTCFMFLYSEFARVHEVSVETLSSWNIIVNPVWFIKYQRASKPLSVTIGSFYYADKYLPLTVLSIIFSNASNLIVTFRTRGN